MSKPTRIRTLLTLAAALALGLALAMWAWRRHRAEPLARAAGHPAIAEASGAMTDMGDMPGMSESSSAGGAAQRGAVQLTANQIRQFGITFGTAEVRALASTVRTVGTVMVDETKLVQIAPRFGGYVERLRVNATGQPVRRGQPLMDVYSPELVAAEQELLVAGNLEQSLGRSAVPGVPSAPSDLAAAARRRLALREISDAQIDEILRTGQVRRTLTLHAPASGVVLEKNVVQGQAIQPGQMLYTIANLADVWVDVALREQDAGAVRVGSGATVQLAAYPGRPFTGRVAYVYPMLDSTARTVRARIEVANPSGLLKPGMYATVVLTTPTRTALTVPTSALVRTGERTLVFVDMGGGRLVPREVETGRSGDQYTEVLAGLEPGQRVVTSAQFLLDSESNLAEVMRSMIGQMGTSDLGNTKDVNGMKDMPGMDMSGGAAGGATPGATPGAASPAAAGAGMSDRGADMKNMPGMPGTRMPSARRDSSNQPRR